MLYVSSIKDGKYGVTDTADGVEEFVTGQELANIVYNCKLEVKGVDIRNKTINVVSVGDSVVSDRVKKVQESIRGRIYSMSPEDLESYARQGGYVTALKKLIKEGDLDKARELCVERSFGDETVKSVSSSLKKYSNVVREVNISNSVEVRSALMNNVCLVLQLGAKNNITSFICTGNLAIMDKLTQPYLVEASYLNKIFVNLMGRKTVPKSNSDSSKKVEGNLKVFSAALRFRPKYAKVADSVQEISSTFYTVKESNLIAMFVLDNPMKLNVNFMATFAGAALANRTSEYEFDCWLYEQLMKSFNNGVFDRDAIMNLPRVQELKNLSDEHLDYFMGMYDFMSYIRRTGCSFK